MRQFLKTAFVSVLVASSLNAGSAYAVNAGVRLKDLAQVEGVRDNALTGYGLVVGLAGTGDSSRSRATVQSVANTLKAFGVSVPPEQINSRNVAAVVLTTSLPAFSEPGQKIDLNVSSMGDARSLLGGTLLLAPMRGADQRIYALAQGQISVGGYKYDAFGNVLQKNHPTVGVISGGATVEKYVETDLVDENGSVNIVLHSPDFTTAERIVASIDDYLGYGRAKAVTPGKVEVKLSAAEQNNIVAFVSQIERLKIVPDQRARVIVNERTGTVVSGGEVKLSKVSVTHGELKVSISNEFDVSQPSFVADTGSGVRSVVTPKTEIEVTEASPNSLDIPAGTTVSDLVASMNMIKVPTRDMITILQAIRRAGGLHAELVIQ